MRLLHWAAGLGLVLPATAHAQSTKLPDLAGTWELATDMDARDTGALYHRLVIRPDTMDGPRLSVRVLTASVRNGDTLSTINRFYTDSVKGDTVFFLRQSNDLHIILQGKQIRFPPRDVPGSPLRDVNGNQIFETFQRVASPKQTFDAVFASGIRPGPKHAIPAHPQAPTGALTDVTGVWQRIKAPDRDSNRYLIIWPDSTSLYIDRISPDMANAWDAWGDILRKVQRLNDSTFAGPEQQEEQRGKHYHWELVLQKQHRQLTPSIKDENGKQSAGAETFQAIDRLP